MSKLKDEQEIVNALKSHFGDKILEAEVERVRRIHVKVADPDQLDVITFAKEKWNSWHMIAVSSVDKPDGTFAVVYHYDIRPPHGGQTAITMNLMVDCPDRNNPKITSITKVFIGAQYFEREAHDLMGIVFEGHPDLSRLILPEDFPEGVYPLRKDFLLEIQKAELEKKNK
ncbi:MAG TPA: NADH-quinone oxidoreductase subunit C [candidate division Zixibacteria bacterium]|nr:NADH-quinone oxidoreductase subunit C [candidate division Zixibacteria bacterium]